jgi:hypothetical protein
MKTKYLSNKDELEARDQTKTSIICLHPDRTSLIYYLRTQTDKETTEKNCQDNDTTEKKTVRLVLKPHASIYIPGSYISELNKLTVLVKSILNRSWYFILI